MALYKHSNIRVLTYRVAFVVYKSQFTHTHTHTHTVNEYATNVVCGARQHLATTQHQVRSLPDFRAIVFARRVPSPQSELTKSLVSPLQNNAYMSTCRRPDHSAPTSFLFMTQRIHFISLYQTYM